MRDDEARQDVRDFCVDEAEDPRNAATAVVPRWIVLEETKNFFFHLVTTTLQHHAVITSMLSARGPLRVDYVYGILFAALGLTEAEDSARLCRAASASARRSRAVSRAC